MAAQSIKVFGGANGWDKPWTLHLSKALIIFFGLMFILGTYIAMFSHYK